MLFCCNDEHGSIDRLRAVEWEDAIKVEPMDIDGTGFSVRRGRIYIAGRGGYEARHMASGAGNMFWESFKVHPLEAARLLSDLRDTGKWNIDSAVNELWRWWESRITAERRVIAEWLVAR